MNKPTHHDEIIRNQLMVHVERIVRPVRATQSRRLRLRTELLDHLQAALAEERRHFPDDEPAAVENAKRRLGEPAELTKKLQQTVPMVERILMARAPIGRKVNAWESRSAQRIYGIRGVMTLMHTAILAAAAGFIVGVPVYMSQTVRDVLTHSAPAAHVETFLVGLLVGFYAMMLASYRFVFAAAAPGDRTNWRGILWRGALIVAMQIGSTFFTAAAGAGRSATAGEVIACATATIALLAAMGFIARRIGILRRPYDPWLSLNIAE